MTIRVLSQHLSDVTRNEEVNSIEKQTACTLSMHACDQDRDDHVIERRYAKHHYSLLRGLNTDGALGKYAGPEACDRGSEVADPSPCE